MTTMRLKIGLIGLILLMGSLSLFSDTTDEAVAKAQALYANGSFADALAQITQAVSGNPDTNGKSALSIVLSDIGQAEYGIKNFKNAWDCFKLALKLKPTNQTATSAYLKIKRELDVNNLKNEAPPRVAKTLATSTPSTDLTGSIAASSAPVISSTSAVSTAEQEKNAAELKAMLAQLKAAQDSLTAAQSTVQSTKGETDVLREQLKSQSSLVEKMIEAQATASKNQATVPAANNQDSKVIQQTLALLADMQRQQSDAASQVIVKQDPAIDAALKALDDKISASTKPKDEFPWIYLILGVMFALILGIVLVIVTAMLRARQRVNREPGTKDNVVFPSASQARTSSMVTQMERNVPLLEFVGSTNLAPASRQDLDLRKSLLKADRLQKMYDDIRNGSLSWETVRLYIDELDAALKADILKLVENKLNTGDLVSHEAVLPIIFPFLNDYDDFLRHKAEKLARTALLDMNDDMNTDGSADPFSVRELMAIPNQLAKILKGNDRSLITANLSRAIAKNLGLAPDECLKIYKGALAHDAGYLMLESSELARILGKAEISDDDFAFIQSHTVRGLQYFGEMELPEFLRDALTLHHERKDGSGYPNGLKGAEIPPIAQIIGVAETFASLLTGRAHRDKMEASHALAILKDGARTKFDRPIVDALVKVVSQDGGF